MGVDSAFWNGLDAGETLTMAFDHGRALVVLR